MTDEVYDEKEMQRQRTICTGVGFLVGVLLTIGLYKFYLIEKFLDTNGYVKVEPTLGTGGNIGPTGADPKNFGPTGSNGAQLPTGSNGEPTGGGNSAGAPTYGGSSGQPKGTGVIEQPSGTGVR